MIGKSGIFFFRKIIIYSFFSVLIFILSFVLLSPNKALAETYLMGGSIMSTNLLPASGASLIQSMSYDASSIPTGTGIKMQFSGDNGNTWFDASGVNGGWSDLSAGVHTIELSGLGWKGLYFHYRVWLVSDGTDTPVLDEVSVLFQSFDGTYYTYPTDGSLVSNDLLNTAYVAVGSFDYTISSLPPNTAMTIQFSQDASSWYSSAGVLNNSNNLSAGTNNIDLSALGWTGPHFYYKAVFTSNGTYTPVIDSVSLNYNVTEPSAPTGLTVTSGNTQISLFWTAPTNDGGSAIDDYVIDYKLTSTSTWTTFADGPGVGTTGTVTGLTNGSSYDFRVSAVNDVGQGTASATATATPATVPGAPTIGTATGGIAQATVTFTAPVSDGGSAITGYTVTSSGGGTDSNAGSTNLSHIMTGLTNGTAYTFTVTATNAIGTSPPSTVSNSVTPATTPDASTALSATAGNAQVALTWSAPVWNGGSVITDYVIEYKLDSDSSWTIFSDAVSTATSTTVIGLINGSLYNFRVSTVNAVGPGSASTPANSTPVTIPGAPLSLLAVKGDTQATISFSPPNSDGGSAILDYTVTASDNIHFGTGTSSPIIVTGLTNGTAYIFTVTARNAVGTGPASVVSNSVTPATVPGAPTMDMPVASNGQVALSWTAPASDGFDAITDYVVDYLDPISGWTTFADGTSPNTGATVTGLTNGVSYYFRVSARNSMGTGAVSNIVSATPITVPGAPTINLVTAGNTQVIVNFTAPADNGGSPITGYTVTSSPDGHTGTGTASPITVTGLSNGTSYTFTVIATNAAGSGPASVASNSVIPITVPSQPTAVSAVAGNMQATVTFMAPNSNGGSPITGYTVTSIPSGGTDSNAGSTNLSHIVTGLTKGGTYTFTVIATNTAGPSLPSLESGSITLPTEPSVPINLAGVVLGSSIGLTWSAPTTDGGSSITDYVIEYQLSTGGSWAPFNDGVNPNTGATVTNLSNGTSYDFRVKAKNIIGESLASAIVSATPGEPAHVGVREFSNLIVPEIVTVFRITNEGLTEYEYQYTWCVTDSADNLCGGGNDIFSASDAKLIASHADFDKIATSTVPVPGNYFFHASVIYGSKTSYTYQSFTAVASFPDAPTIGIAVGGNAQASVSFIAPVSAHGSPITNYTVTSNPGGITGTGTSSPIIVNNLTNGTAYNFTITATNGVGTSPASNISNSVIPVGPPDPPTDLLVTAGDAQVALSWTAPSRNGGVAITDYVVEYKQTSESEWFMFADGTSALTIATVSGLPNGISHDFRVRAVNTAGNSNPSSSAIISPIAPTVTPPVNTGGSGSSGGGFWHSVINIIPTITNTLVQETTPTPTPTEKDTTTVIKTTIPKISETDAGKINPTATTGTTTVESEQIPSKNINQLNPETTTPQSSPRSASRSWFWIIISTSGLFISVFILFLIRYFKNK